MVRPRALPRHWRALRRLLLGAPGEGRSESASIGSVEGWLTRPRKPRGWVLRPWSGAPPTAFGALRTRGLATLDVELSATADLETNAGRVEESLEWLWRRSGEGVGRSLGLIGVGRLAAPSLLAAASPGSRVASLVLAHGGWERRVERPPGLATRWIVSPYDRLSLREARAAAAALGGRHDLVFHEAAGGPAVEALGAEWFASTLSLRARPRLLRWLEELSSRRLPRIERKWALSLQASALLLTLGNPSLRGVTITVGVDCSLLDAVLAAEGDVPKGGCPAGQGADTVVLGGGTYSLHSTYGQGLPLITSTVVIAGNGATLDGEGNVRVLQLASGQLTVESTTVTGGFAGEGGGIYNLNGQLTLTGSTISGNSASRGGGIYNRSANGDLATVTMQGGSLSGNTATNSGGGLYSYADGGGGAHVKIVGSSVTGNTATVGGGAVRAQTVDGASSSLVVDSAVLAGNTADVGGAIDAETLAGATVTVTVAGGSLDGNTATADGGAIAVRTSGQGASSGVTVTGTTISGNTANSRGGAIEVESTLGATVTVNVAGATLVSNTADLGGGALDAETLLGSSVTVTVANSSLVGNTVGLDGGAIRASALTDSSLTITVAGGSLRDNSAGRSGGGLFQRVEGASSESLLRRVTVSGNSATERGGGLYLHGAIVADFTITINGSTLGGNTAGTSGAGLFNLADGGASMTAKIRNSTISGNTVSNGPGGGLDHQASGASYGALFVESSALSGNSATLGGGIHLGQSDQATAGATLQNSIITNTPGGGDCAASGGAGFAGSNNLIDELGMLGPAGVGCAGLGQGAVTQFDPQLADNGGPTATHALLDGSNAIDAGADGCANLTTDQRGARRPLDGDGDQIAICDIGPFEVGETPIFGDGFESGDTTGWDRSVGGSTNAAQPPGKRD